MTDAVKEHAITPRYGTIRDRDGNPSLGLRPFEFPITAVCLECEQPIRLERYYLAEWVHVIPQQPADRGSDH
jgi:hypothetical protein